MINFIVHALFGQCVWVPQPQALPTYIKSRDCSSSEYLVGKGISWVLNYSHVFCTTIVPPVAPLPLCYYYHPSELLLLGILVFLLSIVICSFCVWYYYDTLRMYRDYLISLLINYGKILQLPSPVFRSAFRETVLPAINPNLSGTHTHPVSAAHRSSCVVFGAMLAAKLGLKPYVVQASASDIRSGFAYSRDYHWAKDVEVAPSMEISSKNNLTIIVDCDYYFEDLPTRLMRAQGPVLLYTFQPTTVAASVGEYSFRFDKDNNVIYTVSGGAEYKHKVWKYGVDTIIVNSWNRTKYFIVERRQADAHHEYVFLVPIGLWKWLFSWVARQLVSSPLLRLQVIQNKFVVSDLLTKAGALHSFAVMDIQTKNGLLRSVANLGHFNSATIPITTFDALVSCSKQISGKINQSNVESWIQDKSASSVLVDYLRAQVTGMPMQVYTPMEGLLKYQLLVKPSVYEPDCPALMTPFMSPLIPGAYVPDNSANNERAAIQGRVVNPQANAKRLQSETPSKFLMQCIREFAAFIVKDKTHKGRPVHMDEVRARQNRPSQQALLDKAEVTDVPNRVMNTFTKQEAYEKPGDPRIITTINAKDKRDYSAFIYALSDHAKLENWYAFGKTPREIALLAAKICSNSIAGVNLSDAHRMDGHVFTNARELELIILLLFFDPEFHEEIISLHEAQYGKNAFTKSGIKYFMFYIRGSGSPETALFNTFLAKFIDYFARRMSGQTPNEAYEALGLFGGDDVLSSCIDPCTIGGDVVKRAGAAMGQQIEVEEIKRGEKGVNFLSRFFTRRVWFGDPTSSCDLYRTLSKLHVTGNISGFSPLEKLAQKMAGLKLSDRNTPVISDILNAMRVNYFPVIEVAKCDLKICSWFSQYEEKDNWPNELQETDMTEILAKWLPDANIDGLKAYLGDIADYNGLLRMPVIMAANKPLIKQTVVVNDEMTIITDKLKDIKVRDVCWAFIDRKCHDPSCMLGHDPICSDHNTKSGCKRTDCKFPHVLRPDPPERLKGVKRPGTVNTTSSTRSSPGAEYSPSSPKAEDYAKTSGPSVGNYPPVKKTKKNLQQNRASAERKR